MKPENAKLVAESEGLCPGGDASHSGKKYGATQKMNRFATGQLSAHFHRSEFECRCGCGFATVDAELIRVLEDLRTAFRGRPVTINSGCRCSDHNRAVGGHLLSQHIWGKAADIVVQCIDAATVADCLEDKYPDRYGIGRYNTWTHIDVRETRARWI